MSGGGLQNARNRTEFVRFGTLSAYFRYSWFLEKIDPIFACVKILHFDATIGSIFTGAKHQLLWCVDSAGISCLASKTLQHIYKNHWLYKVFVTFSYLGRHLAMLAHLGLHYASKTLQHGPKMPPWRLQDAPGRLWIKRSGAPAPSRLLYRPATL